MCSTQDGRICPIPREKNVSERKCMKCDKKAVVVTRVNDAFCRECFMVYVTHKFRAAIGKSKLIRDGERVLVGISGGQASSCLLHLIQEGLSGRAHKKLRFKPGLVFIDEGVTIGMSAEERLKTCADILDIMNKTGFPCYVKALEQAMELNKDYSSSVTQKSAPPISETISTTSSTDTAETTPPSTSNNPALVSSVDLPDLLRKFKLYDRAEEQLNKLLGSLSSVSAKEDVIHSLKHQLLGDVAHREGYSKIMLGDCSTRLSVRLLSDIAQGRGAHVAMDTAFADTRHADITIVRPIRDFSSKEIAMYNILNDVPSVFIPTLTTKAPDNTSIEHLTEKFVTGLQADYPSTTSNIMRTGEKLKTDMKASVDDQCAVCQGPLDTDVAASSALNAVQFSQQVSRLTTPLLSVNESSCCDEGDDRCDTSCSSVNRDDLLSELCYACRLMVNDLEDIYRLPEHILKEISSRKQRKKMKSDIKDFLLDPASQDN